jgi:hypothetical protein
MKSRRLIAVPARRTTLFGIQVPSSKQKKPSSETGLNAHVHRRNSEQRTSQMGHSRRFGLSAFEALRT